MKNQPLSYIVDESYENMFVSDKHGVLFFFPWGNRKRGYLLKNRHLKPRIKKFYSVSFTIWVMAMVLSGALTQNIWLIFGGILACSLGWLLTWHLYVKKITQSLSASNASYSEIVLEKISASSVEADEESGPVDIAPPTGNTFPSRQFPINRFSILKRHFLSFIFGITPINWGVLSFLTGIGMFFPISFFFPNKEAHPILEALYTSTALFFLGLFGFIMAKTIDVPKSNISNFISWKLIPILVAILFWGFSLYFAVSGLFANFAK